MGVTLNGGIPKHYGDPNKGSPNMNATALRLGRLERTDSMKQGSCESSGHKGRKEPGRGGLAGVGGGPSKTLANLRPAQAVWPVRSYPSCNNRWKKGALVVYLEGGRVLLPQTQRPGASADFGKPPNAARSNDHAPT